jgi:hypothetical protein
MYELLGTTNELTLFITKTYIYSVFSGENSIENTVIYNNLIPTFLKKLRIDIFANSIFIQI